MSDLYIIQSDITGDIKIGRSKHVYKRLNQLQTGSPYKLKLLLILKDQGLEELKLHKYLNKWRIRKNGEWFESEVLGALPNSIYELLNLEDEFWWQK